MRLRPVLTLTVAALVAWLLLAALLSCAAGDRVVPRLGSGSSGGSGGSAGSAGSVRGAGQDAAGLAWPGQGQAALAVGNGTVLTSGSGARPVPIASLAKIMTGYLVLRAHPLDGPGFTVTVGDDDVADYRRRAADDQSVVPVGAGEELDERQLLDGLLLPSGNNIAILLAVHEAGSVPAFVARMNAAAGELGLHDTVYTDPSGYDAGTVSTAADQVTLVRAAMAVPGFAAIVREPVARLPVAGTVRNTNPLLGRDGVIGVKTGSDDDAGGCLAFAAARAGQTIYGVVLGQRGGPLLEAAGAAARRLLDSGAGQAVDGAGEPAAVAR